MLRDDILDTLKVMVTIIAFIAVITFIVKQNIDRSHRREAYQLILSSYQCKVTREPTRKGAPGVITDMVCGATKIPVGDLPLDTTRKNPSWGALKSVLNVLESSMGTHPALKEQLMSFKGYAKREGGTIPTSPASKDTDWSANSSERPGGWKFSSDSK